MGLTQSHHYAAVCRLSPRVERVRSHANFEWKWHYAFHQVGDESVAEQTQALENGIVHRDSLMGWIAVCRHR